MDNPNSKLVISQDSFLEVMDTLRNLRKKNEIPLESIPNALREDIETFLAKKTNEVSAIIPKALYEVWYDKIYNYWDVQYPIQWAMEKREVNHTITIPTQNKNGKTES